MKKIYKEQKHTLYEISKNTGLSIMTLYKYADETTIDNMALGQFLKVASYENIPPIKLYNMIKEQERSRRR